MCVLRVAGTDFDSDKAIEAISMVPKSQFRKGEPVYRHSRPRGPFCETSGLTFEVSEAEWSGLWDQVQDAIIFINVNLEDLKELRSNPLVEKFVLDFPLDCRFSKGIVGQCDEFPADFVTLAGSVGLALCISNYKVGDDED